MSLSLAEMPDLGATPTASEVIHGHLRHAIVTGQMEEGAPIRQDEVARLFNVSKIPVREALKRLEAEGFVTFHRNRGAVVAGLSEPEIVQIFEARAILESNLLRLSVPQMTEATFARAEACCAAFAAEKDVANWAALNWALHSTLYQDANRPYLMQLVRSVNDRIERYLRVQLTISGGHATADAEHRQILAACRKGDAEGAAALVYDHILGACRSLHKHLGAPA